MVSVVSCPSCGAPIEHLVVNCPFCRVSLHWPGMPAPAVAPAVPPGVIEALRSGNKLLAIKAYHVAKKCGLKEAKDAVDELEKKLGLG